MAQAMRLVPRRIRFRVAMTIAALATPLLRNSAFARRRKLQTRIETTREIVTYHVLDFLTRHGVGFDPIGRTSGLELVDAALIAGRGVLFVGPHAMLSSMALRTLHDMGQDAVVVTNGAPMIQGTNVRARTIALSFTYLLDVRSILRANGIVAAMIDREELASKTAFQVKTAQGTMVIADALIRLGVRCETSIVFFATRISGGELLVTHGTPSPEESESPDAVAEAFVRFLQQHIAAMPRE
jgi:lauroyl/myristoyl acyltransferase